MPEEKKVKIDRAQVRRYNKRRIYQALLEGAATKQELAERTQLSIPKVTQVLAELTTQGLVQNQGIQASSGGRRPECFSAKAEARLAAGINITRNHLDFSILDLNGQTIINQRIRFPVKMENEFCDCIYTRFAVFLQEHQLSCNDLIGVGIALPGIISKDNDFLAYSHVMQIAAPFDLRPLRQHFSIPVTFFNDADAACMAECGARQVLTSFNFVSLSETVGGAIVIDGQIVHGQNGRAGEPGHIQIVPGGRQCYCGKKGHYDAYGSSSLLTCSEGSTLADFFTALEQNQEQCAKIFEEYISYLALLITNLLLWSDLPVLIGGYAASYLTPYLPQIKAKIKEMSIFEQETEYLFLSSYRYEASSVGCARYYIEHFMENGL